MNAGGELLRQTVGSIVRQVSVEVLFYSVEREGALGNVVLDLVDGRRFFLGCAGDGSVFVVASHKKSAGTAPGFTRVERPIVDVAGPLSEVLSGEGSLELTIGDHMALITNEDDELSVQIDRRPLSKELIMR